METPTDKEIEYLLDATEDQSSPCCGAKVVNGFCSDCKEHV